MNSIVIVDYGLGNMRSVSKAVQKAGAEVLISHDLEEIRSADGIILPGVGAFHEGMTQLADLSQALIESEGHVPILGICLGMQMMMEFSEEHGLHQGLGLIPAQYGVFLTCPGIRSPHGMEPDNY
jgi:glutamine amidotransferase